MAFKVMCVICYGWAPEFAAGVVSCKLGNIGSVSVTKRVGYKNKMPHVFSRGALFRRTQAQFCILTNYFSSNEAHGLDQKSKC